MTFPACLRLPFLHPDLPFSACSHIKDVVFLSPGLSCGDADIYWQPPSYPLSRPEAEKHLASLGQLDLNDLEYIRLLHKPSDFSDSFSHITEMRDLARFSGSCREDVETLFLREAQKILIWCWLAEEKLVELINLENQCDSATNLIQNKFMDGTDSISNDVFRLQDFSITSASTLLPAWKTCVANAALFIPPDTALLVEGKMAEEVTELLDFQPSPQWREKLGTFLNVSCAKAPLWKVLGHTHPQQHPYIKHAGTVTRTWLIASS